MESMRYPYWKVAGMFIGCLEAFPDCMTQGIPLEELNENLREIFDELTSRRIPAVRHVAEL
jgi:predicted RNase H-like HicB family nuclease